MQDDLFPSRPRRRWRIAAFVFVPLLLLASAPFALRAYMLWGIPDIGYPFDPGLLDNFEVPDEENAFTYYRHASELLPVEPLDMRHLQALGLRDTTDVAVRCYLEGWQHADKRVKAQLEAYRPALEIWKIGTKQQDARYDDPRDLHVNTYFDRRLRFDRNMTHLTKWALVEAARLAAEDKTDESWEWIHAGFRCSRHIGRFGGLISRLKGAANHAASIQAALVWARHPLVTENDLRAALRDIEASHALTPMNAEVLLAEYYSASNTIRAQFHHQPQDAAWRQRATRSLHACFLYFLGEPVRSLRLLDHYYANQAAYLDRPRPERPGLHAGEYALFDDVPELSNGKRTLSPADLERRISGSTYASIFVSAGGEMIHNAMDREQAQHDCLRIALAAHGYYREQGHFPDDVQQLVPEYLSEAPVDIFHPRQAPLRLVRQQDQIRIYTVYVNGRDDGGEGFEIDGETTMADYGLVVRAPQLNKQAIGAASF